jgi:hypothetical protein
MRVEYPGACCHLLSRRGQRNRVAPARHDLLGGWPARLLSPFPLSSTAEERGIRFSSRLPRVALADSLTRGHFLKPLRGFLRWREEYSRSIEPARALAVETLKLERTLRDLVNQAYGLTPVEIDLMWQTAPPRTQIPPPAT